MVDDVAAIRTVVESVVIGEEKEVVLVTHSAGGFLGCNAIEGLNTRERTDHGKKGSVTKIVFPAGAIWEVGFEHKSLPFFDFQGNRMFCKEPLALLFNDLSAGDAMVCAEKLRWQPSLGWDSTVTYAAWTQIPSVYLLCEKDAVLPLAMQQKMAELAGSVTETCAAGHMPQLSQPHRVVEVVRKAAGEEV